MKFSEFIENDVVMTNLYVILLCYFYTEYHNNNLHAITSRSREHLSIFGNNNLDVHLGGSKEIKSSRILFSPRN